MNEERPRVERVRIRRICRGDEIQSSEEIEITEQIIGESRTIKGKKGMGKGRRRRRGRGRKRRRRRIERGGRGWEDQ